ncbi:phosphoribosylformylglycinamidine synthase subunit PurL [Natronorarus salvus]|uniref:phosphoribosylformylglycinamidine synthase subunit PurL n=1 Tax=Natronorarus salvus TaxID=3117733 RepID=UPI002F260831
MPLAPSDHDLVAAELGRDPTPTEELLFENLWSEHCAYRSSRPLLSAFESERVEHRSTERPSGRSPRGEVVVGPGDDAAVVALDDSTYITLGIESHNHPSYVDPFDGAATGVGGIVRDTLSMGAYPIALIDSLYFGAFEREHSRYLLEGVVEGISHYGNCIGVPTVGGSTTFHPGHEGNPLVNVACVGLLEADRLVTAEAQTPGNALVLVGNATGRDGLGGASFASEDLAEDAETEDRPAVQVGDPYTEKLLIEANEALVDEGLVVSARDLGAAGLGGASSEMVAKGGLGAEIRLERVHQREPNMAPHEILLAESQERMCYEVRLEDVERVREIAERFDLGCSVIGEITDGNYVCTFEESEARSASEGRATEPRDGDEGTGGRETVVDVPAEFLADGAPMNDLAHVEPEQPDRDLPDVEIGAAFEVVVGSPNTACKRWVYRQYDHEVGLRTAVGPGDDSAVLAIREAGEDGLGLAISAGAEPYWTEAAPYEGARAVALENATNLAAKGARPLAAVDCLNGGNPEKPEVYGGFRAIVDGLAEMCAILQTPVVGGNVSLYNDSTAGPIPPTPTLAMVGVREDYSPPPMTFAGEGDLLLVGDTALSGETAPRLGGSELLARAGGSDRFPVLPDRPNELIDALTGIANLETTLATHDVSHGGLAVSLAEMVTGDAGAEVEIDGGVAELCTETPGRLLVETTDPGTVREATGDVSVVDLGTTTPDGTLSIETEDGRIVAADEAIAELRNVLARGLD